MASRLCMHCVWGAQLLRGRELRELRAGEPKLKLQVPPHFTTAG